MCRNFTVRLRRRGHTSIGNDLKTNFIAIGVVSVLLVLVPFFIFWTNSEWDAALYNAQAAADKSASLINIELETYLESSVRIVSSVFVRNGIKTDYQASTQQKVAFYNELDNMLSNYTNSSADTTGQFLIYNNNDSLFEGKYTRRLSSFSDAKLAECILTLDETQVIWVQRT